MRNKMINHGIAVIGIAILILLSIGSASAPPYGGPDAEVTYQEMDVRKEQLISKNPSDYSAGKGFKIINLHFLQRDTLGTLYVIAKRDYNSSQDNYIQFAPEIVNEMFPLFDTRTEDRYNFVIYLSVHPKDPAKPKDDLYYRLDWIDGLMSLEEAQAIVAQKENASAERSAQEAARRQAQEEANRYDPAKFIIVPSYFRPANYTKADLFAAVAASEKLGTRPTDIGVFSTLLVYPSEDFVSDVVFVSQNGTDITFRTADNAISKRMKIETRSGLTAGQKVRIYYTAYNPNLVAIKEWQVIAIERL